MITDFSEPGGVFPSDNFLSNESGYQEVIPALLKTVKPGGAYIGNQFRDGNHDVCKKCDHNRTRALTVSGSS